MADKPRDPHTKELFIIRPPPPVRDTRPAGKSPPPFRPPRSATASLDETPVLLESGAKVTIEGRNGKKGLLEMEMEEVIPFLRSAELAEARDGGFSLERFLNGIRIAHARKEGNGPARYMFIRTDDGHAWRLYPALENMGSVEKYTECRFVTALRAKGEYFFLYWQTPELKSR
ncbi:MAG: hypothetical protein AB1657_00285 [Candidatus Micrarchaeota archaeon]